jgi:hypothetical protein
MLYSTNDIIAQYVQDTKQEGWVLRSHDGVIVE